MILSIDPALTTGWALSPDIYGTWDIRDKKDESWGMRLVRFVGKLKEVVYYNPEIDIIVYERPAGAHSNAKITQAKIIGQIEKFCAINGIQYKGYSAKSIKKFAGHGNASKEKMIEFAQNSRTLQYQGNNDNEVDALFLLLYAKKDLNYV